MKQYKKIITILFILITSIVLFSCKKTVKVGKKTLDVSKTYNIYISQSNNKSSLDSLRKSFVVAMKDLDLVEDLNVKYHYENAKGSDNYAVQIADVYAEQKADLIVTIGATSTTPIFDKCHNAPILFMGCANADKLGLCDSNGNPNGNITGVMDSHYIDERLKYINDNYKDIKKLGIIYTADNKLSKYDIDYTKFYSTTYGIDVFTVSIKRASDINKALDSIMPKVDGIFLIIDDMINNQVETIVKRATAENKPVFGKIEEEKNLGCIVPILPENAKVGKKAAEIANDILINGKKASDIKVITAE